MTEKELTDILNEAFELGYAAATIDIDIIDEGYYSDLNTDKRKKYKKDVLDKLIYALKVLMVRDKEKYKGLKGIVDWCIDHPVNTLIGGTIVEFVNIVITYIAENYMGLDAKFFNDSLHLIEQVAAGLLAFHVAKKQFKDMCNDYEKNNKK